MEICDSHESRIRRVIGALALCATMCVIVFSNGCTRERTVSAQATSEVAVNTPAGGPIAIKTKSARFEIMPTGYVRAYLTGAKDVTLDDPQQDAADYVAINGKDVQDFALDLKNAKLSDATGKIGQHGKRIEIHGKSAESGLEKTLIVEVYDDFPAMAFTTTSYKNTGNSAVQIQRAVSQRHRFSASNADPNVKPYEMYSFSGASEKWGKDDVMPVSSKFSRANVMEAVMHNDENMTGGGVPVVAFWTRDVGEAIGHVELLPLAVSLPVSTAGDGRVQASLTMEGQSLAPGETFSTPLTFVSVYHGDFYEPLHLYSTALQKQGWTLPKATEGDYQANWCGWGYEMNFTPKQMLGTIPKLKELGLKWGTLDAGWFTNRGDWDPRPERFPDDSVKTIADEFHKNGMKITIWWIPIVAEDGGGKDILNQKPYQMSNVVKEHPDWLILDKDGKPARATASLGALCPALPEVQQYYKQLTEKFIRDWGYDGHKLDFSYAVPACYNPKHHHKSPSDSTKAVGDIYKIIFETTRALKPDSVTQSCPCGTPPNFAWLPYIDQAVTADPVGARQVRERTKMYKALLGPQAAVYGDHVELTDVRFPNTNTEHDVGKDFASSVGTGAVLGTKFTWPNYGPKFNRVMLTPEKEQHWKKWIDIYNDKMLSRGTFRNLYIYGYDSPEAYAIEKDGKMYYAFFAAKPTDTWKGTLELRGLEPGKYKVFDYANNRDLGTVDASDPKLNTQFTDHLLIEVSKM